MKYMLTYNGLFFRKYDFTFLYNRNDLVFYDGILYKSLQDFNFQHFPDISPFYWDKVEVLDRTKINNNKQKEKDEMTKICGDHIGNVSGDNVVVYGDNTGNISANGAKSVVVVFGDVTGNITAEQVVRFDNLNPDWVKAAILEEKGKNNA